MENTEQKNEPKLETQIAQKGTALEVNYTIKNNTTDKIYIFNVPWDVDGSGKFVKARNEAYVQLMNDGTLVVAQKIPKLPVLQSVEFREIPYTTEIAAGAEFKATISLPLPIEEFNPYFPKDENTEIEEKLAERVVFEIQYIRNSEDLKAEATAIEGAFSIWHPDLFGTVEMLESRPSPTAIKVNKRKPPFDDV
ncbi:MAG: hypothetical protein R2684_03250 [Pyrinomonadaceae bacterium]